MNFQPLFTAARVMRAAYQVIAFGLLLAAAVRRSDDKHDMRTARRLKRLDDA